MKKLSGIIANALLVSFLVLLLLETVSCAPYCLLRAPYNPPQGNCFQFYLADTATSPARATVAGGVCAVTPLAAREGWEPDPTFLGPLSTWAAGDAAMGVVSPYFDDAYGCHATGSNNSVGNVGGGCPSDQTNCAGTCTDTSSDSQNCGYCGNVCASDASCVSGICSASNGTSRQNAANGTSYQKGSLLAGPISLQANLSTFQDVVFLDKNRPYIVVGEGVCSLWDDHTDGVDSVFCYAQWRIGDTPQVWGQLELSDPSIHLSDLIAQNTGNPAIYNPSHVYEAVVIGEGKTLKARVFDGGGYSDNHGELRISIYQAVATT